MHLYNDSSATFSYFNYVLANYFNYSSFTFIYFNY